MSPQPENPLSSTPVSCGPVPPEEFTAQERSILLQLAHASIASALANQEVPLDPPSSHLAAPRGASTPLYCRPHLHPPPRYPFPAPPPYRTVAETARSAAFEDTRFCPVTLEEAPALEISLSILSPLQIIQAEEVEPGRHGLLISQHGHRGLLLPQVPAEHGWDRVTFLQQTCRKAGLPLDAWQKGATLEAFTAEVFGDGNVK